VLISCVFSSSAVVIAVVIRLIIRPLLLNRRFWYRKLLGRYGVELELDVDIYVFKNCVEVFQSHKGSPSHSFYRDAVEKNIDEF